MTGVITAWMAELVILTLRNVKKGANDNVAGFPLPADYLASFAVFGVLAALPDSAKSFAGVTAWGFVVATYLNFVDPTLNKQTASPPVATGAAPGGPGAASATQVIPARTPGVTTAQ